MISGATAERQADVEPEARCIHQRDLERIDAQIAEIRERVRMVPITLPTELGGQPQSRIIPLYWWHGVWASDPLVAVAFGGSTIYPRGIRVPQEHVGRLAEILARNPSLVIDDEDGIFRGRSPHVLGWARRHDETRRVTAHGIATNAAPINCSREISRELKAKMDDLEAEGDALAGCGCAAPQASTVAMPELTPVPVSAVSAEPEADGSEARLRAARDAQIKEAEAQLRAYERWRNRPGYLISQFVRVLTPGILDKLSLVVAGSADYRGSLLAKTNLEHLGNPHLSIHETIPYQAELAQDIASFSDAPMNDEHERLLTTNKDELAKERAEINRMGKAIRRNRIVCNVGVAAASGASLLIIGLGPFAMTTAGLFLGLKVAAWHYRRRRGKAIRAYVLAAAASTEGDAKEAYRHLVNSRAARKGIDRDDL